MGLYAAYRFRYLPADAMGGFGAGLAWETRFAWENLEIHVKLANLPGLVYIPCLEENHGAINYQGETSGTSPMHGYISRNPRFVELPLLATASCSVPLLDGKAVLEAARLGGVQSFTLGYSRSVGDRLSLTAGYDLLLSHLKVGCDWREAGLG